MRPLTDLLRAHSLPTSQGGKDDKGTLVIVGGPAECPGGALLAGEAALRAGAGRVQLVVHPAIASAVAVAMPEAWVVGWDVEAEPTDAVLEQVGGADAVLIGPGHRSGADRAALALAPGLGSTPLVLDAGALSASARLAGQTELVLAPNEAEAAQLTGSDPDDGAEALAVRLADQLGHAVAVRGRRSAIVDRDGDGWCYESRATGLGTPGSGDVLVGVLGALLARRVAPAAALGWAVGVHGRAGELLTRRVPAGFLAREVAGEVPAAL